MLSGPRAQKIFDKIHLVFDPLLNCAREISDLVDSGHFESNITIDE